MNGKQIFIWSIVIGLAISGGASGAIGLALWVAGFWLIEKAYDGCASFVKGFKAARAERVSLPKQRPNLKVIKGGAA